VFDIAGKNGQAARAAGRSKTTINRAIKTGRLSASRRDDGSYEIDPAELTRAYSGTGNGTVTVVQSVTAEEGSPSWVQLRGERDRYRALVEVHEETIRDLRQRLDREAEERRRMFAILTERRPWWRRWIR
jgi:hypothetical protein